MTKMAPTSVAFCRSLSNVSDLDSPQVERFPHADMGTLGKKDLEGSRSSKQHPNTHTNSNTRDLGWAACVGVWFSWSSSTSLYYPKQTIGKLAQVGWSRQNLPKFSLTHRSHRDILIQPSSSFKINYEH